MSKSQFVSFVPKTLDDNIHSRDINDDVIATQTCNNLCVFTCAVLLHTQFHAFVNKCTILATRDTHVPNYTRLFYMKDMSRTKFLLSQGSCSKQFQTFLNEGVSTNLLNFFSILCFIRVLTHVLRNVKN